MCKQLHILRYSPPEYQPPFCLHQPLLFGIEPLYVAEQIVKHVITWPERKLAQSVCELQPCPQNQSITNHHRCNDCYLIQPLPLPYQQSICFVRAPKRRAPHWKEEGGTVVNNQPELNDLIDLIVKMQVNQFRLLCSSLLLNSIYNRRLDCVD